MDCSLIRDGRGTVGAHAAGVRPGIAFAGRLVILGILHEVDGVLVHEREHADLCADQLLLDEHAVTGRPELAMHHDPFQGHDGVGRIVADDHSLARR